MNPTMTLCNRTRIATDTSAARYYVKECSKDELMLQPRK